MTLTLDTLKQKIKAIVEVACSEASVEKFDEYGVDGFDYKLIIKYPNYYLESQRIEMDTRISERIYYDIHQKLGITIFRHSFSLPPPEFELFKYIYLHHPKIKIQRFKNGLTYTRLLGADICENYGTLVNWSIIKRSLEIDEIYESLKAVCSLSNR